MDLVFKLLLFIGLVRASKFYSELVCASLWGIAKFATGLYMTKRFSSNLLSSLLAFAIAFVVFKYIRESESSSRWLMVNLIGGILLIVLL